MSEGRARRKRAGGEPLWVDTGPARALDVLGIGQNSLDRVGVLDGPPPHAGKIALLEYHELPGGQVATAVLALARLGLRTAYVGAVGDDPAGDAVLAPLRRAGVDLAGVRRVPGVSTQCALILVDRPSGERTVLWHRDARLAQGVRHLDRAAIESARVLHLDGGDPEPAAWAAGVARKAGVPVVLDVDTPAPGVDALLARTDFPLVSRGFAEAFWQGGSVHEALGELVALGARLAVVTLGERGAIARQGDRIFESPAFRVEARDTTGAGDLFHAGFVFALLRSEGPESALRTANAAAALNCRALGAQGGLPTREELDAFLRENEPVRASSLGG